MASCGLKLHELNTGFPSASAALGLCDSSQCLQALALLAPPPDVCPAESPVLPAACYAPEDMSHSVPSVLGHIAPSRPVPKLSSQLGITTPTQPVCSGAQHFYKGFSCYCK